MTDNKEDSRVPVQHRRPQRRKRRLRWGRVFALLIVMAILMTTMFWGAVWAYTHLINAPQANTAAATDKIGKDEVLNKRINVLLLGIDDGDSCDVHHIANRRAEVNKVDGFVQAHLDGTDDFHVCVERLQHLIA